LDRFEKTTAAQHAQMAIAIKIQLPVDVSNGELLLRGKLTLNHLHHLLHFQGGNSLGKYQGFGCRPGISARALHRLRARRR